MNDTKTENSAGWATQARTIVVYLVPVLVVWLACVAWTTFDMGAAWYALGLVVVPVALAGGLTTREMARRWARERGAVLDAPVLDLVHRQVLRSRVGRTLGVTLAFALAVMVTGYYNTHVESFAVWWDRWSAFESAYGVWALAALGYALATMGAEATKPHLAERGSAAVVLDRRHLSDFLDLGLARLVAVYASGAALATAVWLVVRLDSGDVRPSVAATLPLAIGLGSLTAALWASRRRQRAVDDDELAFEELTRTATINALAGAAVAMFAIHTGAAVSAVWSPVPWWAAIAGFVYILFGFGIWFASGTKLVFRTRRIDALRSAT